MLIVPSAITVTRRLSWASARDSINKTSPGTTGAAARGSDDALEERGWINAGMAKVCLRVDSEDELMACHDSALAAGLTSHLIRDSGRTEFGGVPTLTACAIGPAEVERIDAITGHLVPY